MLVIGAGVAGISCAIEAAEAGADVMLVTPGVLGLSDRDDGAGFESLAALAGGNTALAQGGIAAAIGAGDAPSLHAADTVAAGAGLVDASAAAQLTTQGAAAVRALVDQGFGVDRDARAEVAFGLEAAHSRARIVHAGEDRTGAALHAFMRSRLAVLAEQGRVHLAEQSSAVSLLSDHGAVTGAVLRDAAGQLSAVRADAVVLATGGYAALYPQTSNHVGARGEGIVLAARLGAAVADLEFVQFHPTVLAGTGFLVSEALRGAGAVLRDETGERFMVGAHEAAELAPRDVVSRMVHRSMRSSGADHVWLDATGIERQGGPGTLERRFPSITRAVREQGIDWAREAVPVAPAAHYTMGGIVTDLDGRTSLPGLFAVGEVSSTGVHGANRLASNSLLEGLVFGPLAARAAVRYAAAGRNVWELRGDGALDLLARAERLPARCVISETPGSPAFSSGAGVGPDAGVGVGVGVDTDANSHAGVDAEISAVVASGLGIERDAQGLGRVSSVAGSRSGAAAELASMIAEAAMARAESRGAHQRSDFTATDPHAAQRQAWISSPSARHPLDLDIDLVAAMPIDSGDQTPRSPFAC